MIPSLKGSSFSKRNNIIQYILYSCIYKWTQGHKVIWNYFYCGWNHKVQKLAEVKKRVRKKGNGLPTPDFTFLILHNNKISEKHKNYGSHTIFSFYTQIIFISLNSLIQHTLLFYNYIKQNRLECSIHSNRGQQMNIINQETGSTEASRTVGQHCFREDSAGQPLWAASTEAEAAAV